jgi:hypothetical protein
MAKTKAKGKTSLPQKQRKGGNSKLQDRGGEMAGAGNVEQIRDILFGVQMRDYDKRFGLLEERIQKEISNLRSEARKRFDALEDFIKKEVESLSDRLKAEQNSRAKSFQEISKEHRDTAKTLEKKIEKLDEQLAKSSRDFRQQILDLSKSLSDEIHQKHQATSEALAQVAQELRSDKVDRSALSELFVEMAVGLSGDLANTLNLRSQDVENE